MQFQGSIAYAKGIEKVGLLTPDECQQIQQGLNQVKCYETYYVIL